MKKKTKCYIYIRVSTTMQVDGYSLDAQRDNECDCVMAEPAWI